MAWVSGTVSHEVPIRAGRFLFRPSDLGLVLGGGNVRGPGCGRWLFVVVSAVLFWGATRMGRQPKEAEYTAGGEGAETTVGLKSWEVFCPKILIPPPGPSSLEMAQRLSRVESRNVTHLTPDFPVFWEEAKGANVQDVDGNIYLDLTGAFGVSVAGPHPPRVVDGIRDQAGRLIHGMGDVHPPAIKVEFLEALAGSGPWPDSRAILGSSGSEAVEAALKTALLVTGRPGILAFEGAYHGLTLGSLAATHREDFRGPFLSRLYKGVRFAPFPDIWGRGSRPFKRAWTRSVGSCGRVTGATRWGPSSSSRSREGPGSEFLLQGIWRLWPT